MTATESPVRWLSIRQLADEIGISISTAYKWSACGWRSGKFPRYRKLPNGAVRIRRDWFDEWLEGLGPDA